MPIATKIAKPGYTEPILQTGSRKARHYCRTADRWNYLLLLGLLMHSPPMRLLLRNPHPPVGKLVYSLSVGLLLYSPQADHSRTALWRMTAIKPTSEITAVKPTGKNTVVQSTSGITAIYIAHQWDNCCTAQRRDYCCTAQWWYYCCTACQCN
jgi:hypothetical protein